MPKRKQGTITITPNPAGFNAPFTIHGTGLPPNAHLSMFIYSPAIHGATFCNTDSDGEMTEHWAVPDTGQAFVYVTDKNFLDVRDPKRTSLAWGVVDLEPAG